MINVTSFPLVRQNTQDNCIPATIESIVNYHKGLTRPTWSDQTNLRQRLIDEAGNISFPIVASVMNVAQSDVRFEVEDFGDKSDGDWVKRVDDLVNLDELPVAFASVPANPTRIHIRAILGFDGNKFTVFDPGPGTIEEIEKQQMIDDLNRTGADPFGNNVGKCRDILIVNTL
jgi:hypothetical protein